MAPARRDPLAIFEGEKLKSGVYKIQNLYAETFLDIHLYSMEACCRPAKDLEDGRGLVSPHLHPVIRTSNNHAVGDRKIGGRICSVAGESFDIQQIPNRRVLIKMKSRLIQESLVSFSVRIKDLILPPHFLSLRILRPGESSVPQMPYTVVLNMFGGNGHHS